MILIHDRVDAGQQLPLTALLKRVLDFIPAHEPTKTWRILNASGYGQGVCQLEDEVDRDGHLEMNCSKLILISEDPNQWFYDLHVLDDELGIEFGLFDSSYLFLGGNEDIGRELASTFQKVTLVARGATGGLPEARGD